MIRIALAAAAVASIFGCAPEDPPVTASAQTSPGGLTYTLLHMPDHPDVAITVAWPTDWAYRAEVNQAAPFVGADLILVGGAGSYAPGEAGERFADLNAEAQLFTVASDHMRGELVVEIHHASAAVAIANAHLRAPSLNEGWFLRLRDGFAADQAETLETPLVRGYEALRWAMLGAQPLREALSPDPHGSIATLRHIDVVAWHAETFTRAPEAVVIAGGLAVAEAGPLLDALLAGLPEARPVPLGDATLDAAPRRILLHAPEAPVTTLALVGVLPPTRQGGEVEDLLLVQALGGDDQSVLFKAVRTDLRASYSFRAGVGNFSRTHRVLATAGEIDPARATEAEAVVRRAYAAFRQEGPADIAGLKAPVDAHLAGLPEYVLELARAELEATLDGADPGRSLALRDELAGVDAQSVAARLAEAWPETDDLITVVVSPDPAALPGACIVTAAPDAAECP